MGSGKLKKREPFCRDWILLPGQRGSELFMFLSPRRCGLHSRVDTGYGCTLRRKARVYSGCRFTALIATSEESDAGERETPLLYRSPTWKLGAACRKRSRFNKGTLGAASAAAASVQTVISPLAKQLKCSQVIRDIPLDFFDDATRSGRRDQEKILATKWRPLKEVPPLHTGDMGRATLTLAPECRRG